jgi:hypothetical protein
MFIIKFQTQCNLTGANRVNSCVTYIYRVNHFTSSLWITPILSIISRKFQTKFAWFQRGDIGHETDSLFIAFFTRYPGQLNFLKYNFIFSLLQSYRTDQYESIYHKLSSIWNGSCDMIQSTTVCCAAQLSRRNPVKWQASSSLLYFELQYHMNSSSKWYSVYFWIYIDLLYNIYGNEKQSSI